MSLCHVDAAGVPDAARARPLLTGHSLSQRLVPFPRISARRTPTQALPRPTPTPALTGQESNLLALKVARIQARIYAHHMSAHGVPPPAVQLPEGATWGPLVQNAAAHHAPTAAPPPLAADSRPTP
ncbi:hypothetical protein Q5752_005361 [Cryptotrichosporon argae]